MPYNYGGEFGHEPGAAALQVFQSSVYSVELAQPPPLQSRPGATDAISYVVQIAKTQAKGAVVRDCLFEDSSGFFARWKSSDAVMEDNVFRGNGYPIVEMQVLPSFYEGPPHTRNVTLRNNSFGVGGASGSFLKNEGVSSRKSLTLKNLIDVGPPFCEAEGLVQERNTIFFAGGGLKTDDHRAAQAAAVAARLRRGRHLPPHYQHHRDHLPRRRPPSPPPTEAEIEQLIQKVLERSHTPSASIAITRNGSLIWARAFGQAFLEPAGAAGGDDNGDAHRSTRYWLASVTKTTTALYAAMRWEEGKLDLDRDINAYLASAVGGSSSHQPRHFEVRNPQHPLAPITARMLMAHTSSVQDGGI